MSRTQAGKGQPMEPKSRVRYAKSRKVPGTGGRSGLLQPLGNTSVVDRIIDRLTKAILDRELQPGQKIPTEVELCESMLVGRNSVREAIKVLVTMGVLEIRRSEGTFVTEGFSERMLDPMVYGLILEGGDSSDIIELREVFESGVVRSAVEKRDESGIVRLKEALDSMSRVIAKNGDPQAILEEDMKFHRVLAGMVKNPLVDKVGMIVERLTVPSRLLAIRRFIDQGQMKGFLNRHKDILRVIVEQNSAAVNRVLNEHFVQWKGISKDQRGKKTAARKGTAHD